jgi:hypothetical protein
MKSLVFASLILALPAAAFGQPLKARNVKEVRVALSGRAFKGLQVRPTPEGWRLQLGATQGTGSAEIIDVTPGTPARTVTVPISAGDVLFDRVRFAGGHVYRVQLRVDGQAASSGYVYLAPEVIAKEPKRAETERVKFDANEPAPAHEDAILHVEKSPL